MNKNRNFMISTVTLALLLLSVQTVSALAPGEPAIYLQVDPSTKVVDTPPGGSLDITINVLSQSGYAGNTQLSLVNPPSGVTATFAPNPVAVPELEQSNVKMTITIASTVPEGKVTLAVNAKGVEDSKITKTLEIELNIGKAVTTTTSTTSQPSTTVIASSTTTQSNENQGIPSEILYAIVIVVVIAIVAVAFLTMRKKK